MTIPKVTKDGKVAVIVSDGYGIGFSTSMSSGPAESKRAVFDPKLVQLIQDGASTTRLAEAMALAYEDDYFTEGCLEGLYIEWIPEGVAFRIDQTDGAEYIVRADELPYVA